MFNIPPDKPRASGFNSNPFGFQNQAWSRFDFGQEPSSTSSIPQDSTHHGQQAFNDLAGMDWTPSSEVHTNYHYSHQEQPQGQQRDVDATELEALSSPQHGGGVGRLVAHFETKGFNSFDSKSFSSAPALPPRPVQNVVGSPQNNNHGVQSPVMEMNDFQAGLGFENVSFGGNQVSGTPGPSSFNPNRIASPISTSGEHWSSFTSINRVASNLETTSPPMSYGNFHDQSATSPVMGAAGQFGSLDDFMSVNRVNSPITYSRMPDAHIISSPMVVSPIGPGPGQQSAPQVGGTPGFEIWRPPGQNDAKVNGSAANHFSTTSPSHTNHFNGNPSSTFNNFHTAATPSNHLTKGNATNSAGFIKPPVPTTPKPNISIGNQFILELNPSAKAKGKAPTKPPRPRVQVPAPTTFEQNVKEEPATPKFFQTPKVSSTPAPPSPSASSSDQKPGSLSLRSQAGTRPSREQVPAEAWEQFKGTIRTLYLEERKPLKEVMAIMSEKYSFQATPKMYKTRFSQWGFVKNNTEEEVKRLLSMKFQRDAEGKVSEFVRNGRVVNLGTYLKRKGVTEYDLVDFELSTDLPSHIRCRTPTPPPATGYLRSPDLVRAQELVVGNMRKAFLHCRQFEVETDACIGWPTTMVWGAGSSDLLLEANFYFEARDADTGGDFLMKAFKQLELDLKKLSPLGINELLLGMVHRDPGMMTALCKYLAAYSATNFERSHPLRQIFTCLYEVQQKHGSSTVSELLWGSVPTIAEELEAIYSRRHPYVTRTWIDLALFYNHINVDHLEKLVSELRIQQRQVEQRHGLNSPEALTLRYSILQMLYVMYPLSDSTRQAAHDMWNHLKSMGVVFALRDAKPNVFCYHSPVKVDPWTKRCRRRYDSGVAILEEHVGVRLQPYFEEDFHHAIHVPDAQEAWSSALDHMGSAKYSFI